MKVTIGELEIEYGAGWDKKSWLIRFGIHHAGQIIAPPPWNKTSSGFWIQKPGLLGDELNKVLDAHSERLIAFASSYSTMNQ